MDSVNLVSPRLRAALLSSFVALAAAAGPVSAATLLGDEIDITLTGRINLQDDDLLVDANIEIVGGDSRTNFGGYLFAGEFIDIGADTIEIVLDAGLGRDGVLTFSDLDFGVGIGDVILVSSTNAAITQSDVSFTDTSVIIDVADLFFETGGGDFQLRLDEIAAVPLPAGGVLLLSGMIGFAGLRRRSSARG